MLKNTVLCFILFMIDTNTGAPWITIILACYSSFIFSMKCVIAIINQLGFLLCRCCC